MIVYVETNFVLELALLQEQHEACQEILSLAAQRRIQLVIPAYSLIEPFETTTRNFKKRQALSENVRNELRQLGRSAPYTDIVSTLDELTELFVTSQEEEKNRLQNVLNQLLNAADIIPLTLDIVANSLIHQANDFSPQDAVVYASILEHLSMSENGDKVFLNRNSKDFDNPDVHERLQDLGCKLLSTFDIAYIKHVLIRQDM